MGLTVHDALKLDVFKRFRLIAGMNGLDRKITKAGILDHEVGEQVRETVQEGEFICSNLLAIKGRPEMIVDFVKHLIGAKAACFAIKTIYFNSIPKDAIELAQNHGLPVFLFDDLYVENLILAVHKAIYIQDHDQHVKLIVDQMTNSNLNEFRIRELANNINRSFKNNIIVCNAKENLNNDKNVRYFDTSNFRRVLGESCSVISYNNRHLIIFTYDEEDHDKIHSLTKSSLKSSGLLDGSYVLGLSEIKNDLGSMGRALDESKYAYDYALANNMSQASFDNMGIYQFLFPIINNPWVCSFYKRVIDKIVCYDKRKGTDLLNTAIAYFECGGNIQDTSERMFLHTNTIRYRMQKINDVLEIDQLKGMSYETLAIAMRLHIMSLKN